MKRRKNAIYKGQSKRVSTGRGDRYVVEVFYKKLNETLLPEDEIEIIPLEQVKPRFMRQKQSYIMADYCVRKILPEITSLFRWGDEVTPRLRALAPIVNKKTAKAAVDAAYDAAAAESARFAATYNTDAEYYAATATHAAAAHFAAGYAADAIEGAFAAGYAPYAPLRAAECVYHALVACIEADDEAAYDRIIDLTNEMLESL